MDEIENHLEMASIVESIRILSLRFMSLTKDSRPFIYIPLKATTIPGTFGGWESPCHLYTMPTIVFPSLVFSMTWKSKKLYQFLIDD